MIPITTAPNERVTSKTVAMTPLNLYLQRIGSVSNKLRAESTGYSFIPFQLGGLEGQRHALSANVSVTIIDFKVSGE